MQGNRWRLEKKVGVSALVQLATLAGLIVGSWVNLQRQLDLVSRDVKQLLAAQEKLGAKVEGLQERAAAQEWRVRELEQREKGKR
jgi:outer membrane murein-binding lipoprotein Lpp